MTGAGRGFHAAVVGADGHRAGCPGTGGRDRGVRSACETAGWAVARCGTCTSGVAVTAAVSRACGISAISTVGSAYAAGASTRGLVWAGTDGRTCLRLSLRTDLRRAFGFGGYLRHTLTEIWISSFSLDGTIRHHERGSDRYRNCEPTSSGSFLFSITGRVQSQVSTPGGSTYSHTKLWLKGNPIAMRKTTYGTVMPVNTAIHVIGTGAGNRKSYSL
jgi:hypothetical protein